MHWKPNKEIWWFSLSLLPWENLRKSLQFQNFPNNKLRLNQIKCYSWIDYVTFTQQRGPLSGGSQSWELDPNSPNIHIQIPYSLPEESVGKNHPSLNTFQKKSHSLIKFSCFCVIGRAKWRATNVFLVSEVKDPCQKHRKRMSDSSLQKNWKKFHTPSSFSPISSSFLVRFVIKKLMGAQTRALQNFFVFQRQICKDKRSEAQNLNRF
jgi:hypothetical protein